MGNRQQNIGFKVLFRSGYWLAGVIHAVNRDEQAKNLIQAAFRDSFVSEKWIIFVFLIFIG